MFRIFASFIILSAALVYGGFAHATSTPAAKRAYTEVKLGEKYNDPKAAAIAEKILKDDIEDARSYVPTVIPHVYAIFHALGEKEPKTSIIAMLEHPAVCGSSGCRTVILTPTGNNKYKITFDATLVRLFLNKREGHAKYDILATAPPRIENAFGVFFWDDAKGMYKFAGLSRFAAK